MERPHGALGVMFPAFGERRFLLRRLGVEADQAIKQLTRGTRGRGIDGGDRIERLRVADRRGNQALAVHGLRGWGGRRLTTLAAAERHEQERDRGGSAHQSAIDSRLTSLLPGGVWNAKTELSRDGLTSTSLRTSSSERAQRGNSMLT